VDEGGHILAKLDEKCSGADNWLME